MKLPQLLQVQKKPGQALLWEGNANLKLFDQAESRGTQWAANNCCAAPCPVAVPAGGLASSSRQRPADLFPARHEGGDSNLQQEGLNRGVQAAVARGAGRGNGPPAPRECLRMANKIYRHLLARYLRWRSSPCPKCFRRV